MLWASSCHPTARLSLSTSSGAAIGGGAGTVIGGFGWRPGKSWSIANAEQLFIEHVCPASLDQAGHDDNHVEINGAWLRITARGPDFESPWYASRPPTWEEWVAEGLVWHTACSVPGL